MRYFYIFIILCLFNCNNERVLQLPEVENAEVSEVLDVSPAYIFYDETQPDSTLLNRNNLIITTNWLLNIDKRLTLRQAMPHIKFLQDKKRNAEMHKNEEAKNYFTCNDTGIGNLGFIEFTYVNYSSSNKKNDFTVTEVIDNLNLKMKDSSSRVNLLDKFLRRPDTTQIFEIKFDLKNVVYFGNTKISRDIFLDYFSFFIQENKMTDFFTVQLYFNKRLSFQDYISIKSTVSKIESNQIKIRPTEFIY